MTDPATTGPAMRSVNNLSHTPQAEILTIFRNWLNQATNQRQDTITPLAKLAEWVYSNGNRRSSWRNSQNKAAEQLGLSKSAAARHFGRLAALGLIQRRKLPQNNAYRFEAKLTRQAIKLIRSHQPKRIAWALRFCLADLYQALRSRRAKDRVAAWWHKKSGTQKKGFSSLSSLDQSNEAAGTPAEPAQPAPLAPPAASRGAMPLTPGDETPITSKAQGANNCAALLQLLKKSACREKPSRADNITRMNSLTHRSY